MSILEELDSWEELLYNNIEKFMLDIIGQEVMDVHSIGWSSDNFNYVYILHSGQHIASSISMKSWLEFKEEVINDSKR